MYVCMYVCMYVLSRLTGILLIGLSGLKEKFGFKVGAESQASV